MTEVEFTFKYDYNNSVIGEIVKLNNQICGFIQSLLQFKSNQTIKDFEEIFNKEGIDKATKSIEFDTANIAMMEIYIKWLSVLSMTFASEDPDFFSKFNEIMKELGMEILIKNNKKRDSKKEEEK